MRIIGIDPGTATTGFSIIEKKDDKIQLLDYGCIKTKAGLNESIRLTQIAADLRILIEKWKPTDASIEKIFFNKNIRTAISVAQARGVILLELNKKGIPQKEFTPLEIKTAVCGYGKADKKMVQEMVKTILSLDHIPEPDDAADAIATGICLANTMQIK